MKTVRGAVWQGSEGDGFRRSMGSEARLIRTFKAGSHFEAMTIYHRLLGREPYMTEHLSDMEQYPPCL
jgi:hypothetical protein